MVRAPLRGPQHAGAGEIAIDDVVRGRYQPRREFAQESLEELAASIRTQGLMQPIVVRPRPQGGYELIAGERRWRAARLAGLQRIAAVIKDVSDEQAVGHGADREHPARGPEPAGGSHGALHGCVTSSS
jgi:ParB/RepB/Spo0J family partition protein